MSVTLVGEERVRQTRRTSKGTSTYTDINRFYDFTQSLDSEKEYSKQHDYNFEIKIPNDVLGVEVQQTDIGGKLGQGIKFINQAAAMSGMIPRRQIKWYLQAKLDIPGGLDVSKEVDITIG